MFVNLVLPKRAAGGKKIPAELTIRGSLPFGRLPSAAGQFFPRKVIPFRSTVRNIAEYSKILTPLALSKQK